MEITDKTYLRVAFQPWKNKNTGEIVHTVLRSDDTFGELVYVYAGLVQKEDAPNISTKGEEEFLKEHSPLPCKYAVGVKLDQTFGYLVELDGSEGYYWTSTTRHPEVSLFPLRTALEYKEQAMGLFIEAVPDEKEFKDREDTW